MLFFVFVRGFGGRSVVRGPTFIKQVAPSEMLGDTWTIYRFISAPLQVMYSDRYAVLLHRIAMRELAYAIDVTPYQSEYYL